MCGVTRHLNMHCAEHRHVQSHSLNMLLWLLRTVSEHINYRWLFQVASLLCIMVIRSFYAGQVASAAGKNAKQKKSELGCSRFRGRVAKGTMRVEGLALCFDCCSVCTRVVCILPVHDTHSLNIGCSNKMSFTQQLFWTTSYCVDKLLTTHSKHGWTCPIR